MQLSGLGLQDEAAYPRESRWEEAFQAEDKQMEETPGKAMAENGSSVASSWKSPPSLDAK